VLLADVQAPMQAHKSLQPMQEAGCMTIDALTFSGDANVGEAAWVELLG
jgi:hypothetical protein